MATSSSDRYRAVADTAVGGPSVRETAARAERFRRMHQGPEVLVLPNVWDAGSAVLLGALPRVRAVGTTSAGMAAAHGVPDGERMAFDALLGALSRITRAVRVPVSVDLEAGYGRTPQEVADSVASVIEFGAAGVNLEDGRPDAGGLLDPGDHAERVAAARAAADRAGVPLVVNARTDTYWRADGPAHLRFGETVRRLNLYHEAGADCLFVPGFPEPGSTPDAQRAAVAALVAAVDGMPLNLLGRSDLLPVGELHRLGVRRLSVGSALYRLAMSSARDAMEDLLDSGEQDALGAAERLPYGDLSASLTAAGEGW